MNPKFCPRCGEPTSEGFKFCKKCGNQLIAVAPQPTPVTPPLTPITPPPTPVTPPVMPPITPPPTPVPPMMNDGERTVLLDKSDAQQAFRPSDEGNTLHLRQGQMQGGGNGMSPVPPHRNTPPHPPIQVEPPKPPKKKGNGMQTVIIVLLILILLAVLVVGVYIVIPMIMPEEENRETDKPSSNNSTYELVKADISWKEAAKKAEEKGGYLACIQDKDEEKEIIEYLNEEGADLKVVYIGGERNGDEFRWVNDDDFDYTDWTPGEPNNGNNVENYVCLYNIDMVNDAWGWNDCPDDMYQNYGGQFSGYTAYLIEYEESDDDRDSDDRDDDDRNKDDEEDSRNDEDDARRDDEDDARRDDDEEDEDR